MILQIAWCARCRTAFTFTGTRVERTEPGRLAVRHDCGAFNELAPNGLSEDGHELYVVSRYGLSRETNYRESVRYILRRFRRGSRNAK
jgi:hypothetical protein